jgi:hypothetical protein
VHLKQGDKVQILEETQEVDDNLWVKVCFGKDVDG